VLLILGILVFAVGFVWAVGRVARWLTRYGGAPDPDLAPAENYPEADDMKRAEDGEQDPTFGAAYRTFPPGGGY
jgi:hypothetical protein